MARFVQRPDLTGIALAWMPEEGETRIADEVAPYFQVFDRSYEYDEFLSETFYNIVDDVVGPISSPNTINWAVEKKSGILTDHGLKTPVAEYDTATASGGMLNPDQVATMLVMNAVSLNREKRVADKVFTLNNYLSTQRETLSGSDQFSHADSDPVRLLRDRRRRMLKKANTCVMGEDVWAKVETNPKAVSAALGNDGTSGVVTPERFAELIGMKLLIGDSMGNAELPGQPPVIANLWGKHVALLYTSPLVRNSIMLPPTFIATPRLKNERVAGTWEVEDMGLRGGRWVKAGESVEEKIIAPACGRFLQNAVV